MSHKYHAYFLCIKCQSHPWKLSAKCGQQNQERGWWDDCGGINFMQLICISTAFVQIFLMENVSRFLLLYSQRYLKAAMLKRALNCLFRCFLNKRAYCATRQFWRILLLQKTCPVICDGDIALDASLILLILLCLKMSEPYLNQKIV